MNALENRFCEAATTLQLTVYLIVNNQFCGSDARTCSFRLARIPGLFSSKVYSVMRFRNRSACLTFIAFLMALLPAIALSQETSWQKENAVWREQHKADLQ